MRLGGVTPLTADGINLAYLFATALAAFVLFRSLTGSATGRFRHCRPAENSGSLSVFHGRLRRNPYAVLDAVLAQYPRADFGRRTSSAARLGFGGGTLALCYLTKAVGVMLVVPTLIVFASAFFLCHGRASERITWLFIGFALPVLSWEAFRLIEIGSWRGYRDWWTTQFGQTLLQSGTAETLYGHPGPIAKGIEHLNMLGRQVGTPPIWLAIFLLAPWLAVPAVIARLWRGGDLKATFCLAACWTAALLYFVWWLFIEATDQAWLRRIVTGLMLQQVIAVIALVALAHALSRSGVYSLPRRLVLAGSAVVLTISEAFFLLSGGAFFHPPTASADDLDQIPLAKTIRELPADATLFGFGWWKAPVLALFSGRPTADLYAWDPEKINALPHKYLVVDFTRRVWRRGNWGTFFLPSTRASFRPPPGALSTRSIRRCPLGHSAHRTRTPTNFGPDTSPQMALTPQREDSIARKAASRGSNPTRPCGCDGKNRPMSRSRSMSRRSWPPKRGTLPWNSAFKAQAVRSTTAWFRAST